VFSLKNKVALWAAAGLMISMGWFLYASTSTVPLTLGNRMVWTLVQDTQPVIFASSFTHTGLKFYWVFLGNALTYGLIGLIFETVRRRVVHR
jgi:hypothetical protein